MISKIFIARRSTGIISWINDLFTYESAWAIIKVIKLRRTNQVQNGLRDFLCCSLYLSIIILYPILYECLYYKGRRFFYS